MRLRFGILLALIIAIVAVVFSSFLVGSGLRVWAAWQARRHGIRIELEKIDAPLLRPVTIRSVRIHDAQGASFRIEVDRAIVRLNLAHILFGVRGRDVRSFSAERLHIEVIRSATGGAKNSEMAWSTLERLLPGSFNVANLDFRIQNEDAVVLLRNASVSASEIEAGRFAADELTVASPLLHQTFSHLRGATKWQDDRLTLGGITLSRGLDLQSLVMDLSHLSEERADFQFDLDTFGGKIRASFSDEWRPANSLWSFAGSANDISLAQTSEGLGFADRLGGSLRACKFTFRGDPGDLSHATASIWMELSNLDWRKRAAEIIMFGAAVYDRQLQLQQLYVKQRDNQLVLSGEGSIPSKPSELLNPDFRGNVSGSIKDLGAFASLFGAEPGDFAGTIAIEGTMNARDRKIGGHVTASGKGLSIFKTQVNEFTASLGLKASQLEVEQFDLNRKKDWLHAEGKFDIGTAHNYSGSVSADVKNLSEYLSIFGLTNPSDSAPAAAHFQFAIESGIWNGNVTIATASSRPIDIGVISLPLWIGETWNEFSIRPLNIIFSFPLVSFENAPRWLGFNLLNGGLLSGGLHLGGTLRNPNFDGDLQLINGKLNSAVLDVMGMGGRVRFHETRGTIDFLRLTNKNADLSFTGYLDAANPAALVLSLNTNLPLLDLSSYPLSCASRLTISPTETLFAPTIAELQLRGGLFENNWAITMQSAPTGSSPLPALETRSISFCHDRAETEQTITLGVYSPPQGQPGRPRKRTRRR